MEYYKEMLFIGAVVGIFAGMLISTALAHTPCDNIDTVCDYVEVETPGGGRKMVYVCE